MRIDYPRGDRTGARRFIPSLRQLVGLAASLMLAGVLALALLLGIAWAAIDVPEENEVAVAQTSIVYWADGTTEMARLGDTNRISIPLSEVPIHVQHAVLAAEDRDFYNHHGFAARGFLRAMWTNLRTGSAQGGSTITQQYAKNAYLSSDKTWVRKLKELVLSLKLELQLSKDEILERYLNTIFFGRGAYGIQTASEAYFREDAPNLTLEQGAVLAAIINAPGVYSPDTNPDKLEARYDYVLDGMVSQGWLSAEDAEAAKEEFPTISKRRASEKFAGPTGHVLSAVQQEVLALGIDQNELESGGLRIVSTVDRAAQQAAVDAVAKAGPTTGTKGLRIGLASVRPVTGEVVALYGGADYLVNSLNNATQAIAQAGSTFKPFALAAATEQGIGLYSVWPGNSPTEVADYTVNNFSDTSYGYQVSLRRATEQSINTAYVALSEEIGAGSVKDAALRAGIPEGIARLTRSSVNAELENEHVAMARSRGLPEGVVIRRHVLRNAMIPVVTVSGISIAALVAASVVVEYAFGLGGLGSYLVQAVSGKDFAVVQAIMLLLVAAFIVINALVDVAYTLLDPRMKATSA